MSVLKSPGLIFLGVDGWRILVSFKGAAVAFTSFRSRCGNSLHTFVATHSTYSL